MLRLLGVLGATLSLPLAVGAECVCPHDADGSRAVEVYEVVGAVDDALNGCGAVGSAPTDPLPRVDVEAAYQRGRRALLALDVSSGSVIDSDEVWAIERILDSRSDPLLDAYVDERIASLSEDPLLRLVLEDAAPLPIPDDLGSGIQLWSNYVLAPLGSPTSRASELIVEYLEIEDAAGYILTHQWLALIWAGEQGVALPADVLARDTVLIEQLIAEQAADAMLSDLFAERSGLLLRFADLTHADAASYARVLMAGQLADGTWPRPMPADIVFDGDRATAQPGVDHILVLSLLALRGYLDRCPSDTTGDGVVDVVEVIEAVDRALTGCSAGEGVICE